MAFKKLNEKEKNGLWLSIINLDKSVIELHRILINMEQFSRLENVKGSKDYQIIRAFFDYSFYSLKNFGLKYDITHERLKSSFENCTPEMVCEHRTLFKSQTLFGKNEVSDFINKNSAQSRELFELINKTSAVIHSYSNIIFSMEPNISNHLDYKFNNFHNICKNIKPL